MIRMSKDELLIHKSLDSLSGSNDSVNAFNESADKFRDVIWKRVKELR